MTGRHAAPDAELTRIEADELAARASHLALIGQALRVARHGELDALMRDWISQVTAVLEAIADE